MSLSFLDLFFSFWFIIVSIATAVLPVWRSPIISSLWPLPTGTNASIALRPVCIGSETDSLGIIPGALTSTIFLSLVFIVPLPSISKPKPSTTLPNNSLPTKVSTILPVLFTISPSLIFLSSPKITTPTLSSSRLRAIPCVLSANSTISPALTSSRP